MSTTIIVNEELKAYIDPLTPEEHAALERSLLAEGCRDALVLWGDILIDGHNRYGICQKHGLPFNTVQHPHFRSMEDVHLWMIDQHLGRRSVSDFQRGVLALRKREILAQRAASAGAPAEVQAAPDTGIAVSAGAAEDGDAPWDGPSDAASAPAQSGAAAAVPQAEPLRSREAIARAAGLEVHAAAAAAIAIMNGNIARAIKLVSLDRGHGHIRATFDHLHAADILVSTEDVELLSFANTVIPADRKLDSVARDFSNLAGNANSIWTLGIRCARTEFLQ